MTDPDVEEPFDAQRAGGGDALPAWLLVVSVVLLVWGAWYLVRNWGGPGGLVP